MANFTMELRTILERNIDIGLDDYPIFDEEYRPVLNRRITDHYRYREIGFETIDQFIDRLNHRMRLIMPAYNKWYESTLMDFDPFITQRFMREETGKIVGTDTTERNATSQAQTDSESTSKSRAVNSDFPQTMLSETGDYASSASDSVADSGSTSQANEVTGTTGSDSMNRDNELLVKSEGMTASPSALLLQFRETIINVDMMVINELDSLFMGLWNINDEYGNYNIYMYPIGYLGGTF